MELSQKSGFSFLPGLKELMYHNINSHSVRFEKKDLFKSVEKFTVAIVKKNKHFFSAVIHLKLIALSFLDCPLGIYLLHCIIFKY